MRRSDTECDVRFGSKADMCSALAHVCHGPIADIGQLFDYLVGASKHGRRNGQTKILGRFKIDHEFKLRRLEDRHCNRLTICSLFSGFYLGYSTNIIRVDTPPVQRARRGRAKVHTCAEPRPGVPQNLLFNPSGCLCLVGCLHGRFARLTACNDVRPACIARSTKKMR